MANPVAVAPVAPVAPVGVTSAASQQAAQAALVSLLADPLDNAWQLLTPAEPSTMDTFVAAVTALIHHFGLVSATQAARFYEIERRAAGVGGSFSPRLAPTAPPGKVDASMRWATKDLWAPQPDLAAIRSNVDGAVTKNVLDTGRLTIIDAVKSDRLATGWARETEPGACSFCVLLATRGMAYRSEKSAEFQSHDHCVPGDTLVNGPSAEVAYRRWYEGELVILRTSGGAELSITPNHPVLTNRGWVAAGLLNEGDEVAERFGADMTSLRVPHEDEMPSLIEDVWRSHSMDGLRRVPVTAEDFHGDTGVRDGNVEIVWANRFLSEMVNAQIRQLLTEPIGAGTGTASVAMHLPRLGDLGRMGRSSWLASDGIMGRASKFGSSSFAQSLQPNLVGAASRPGGYAGFDQPTSDDIADYASSISNGQFRSTGDIFSHSAVVDGDAVRRDAPSVRARYDPASQQGHSHGLGVPADLGRSLLERLSGGVQLSRLSNLHRIDFAGHVFNLQTAEGWYDANSVVVGNCRCFAAPQFGPYTPSAQVAEWQQLYRDSTRGVSGAAARNAFRKAFDAQQPQQ